MHVFLLPHMQNCRYQCSMKLWGCALIIVMLGSGMVTSPTMASSRFVDAIRRERFDEALSIAPTNALRTYAQWHYLRSASSTPNFDEVLRFIKNYPDWPDQSALRSRAEKALFQSHETGEHARSFLTQYPPISGYGMLVAARNQMGDITKHVKQAWVQGDFDKNDEQTIMHEFASFLDTQDYVARIDRLLRDDRASIAERFLGRVSAADEALFRARIALIRHDHGVEGLVSKVPAAKQSDDGLLADRAIWRRSKGLESGTIELLRQMRPASAYAIKLWPLRAEYAREMIEERRYGDAVALLDNMGKLDGAHLADALWMRGWVRLEFMHEASTAYTLFHKLYSSVNFPVSKARAAYWAGRAAERNGNPAIANDWYQKAAKNPTVFYGQLAFSKVYPGKPLGFGSAPSYSDSRVQALMNTPLMQAAKSLNDMGEPYLTDPLIKNLAEQATEPSALAEIVIACQNLGMRFGQIRAVKIALQKNVVMLKEGWPTVRNPQNFDVELPLAYAISRQESEFNTRAISPTGARGLMQLMPATAKVVARQLGAPFDVERLFDPNYNMRLGTHYLGNLVSGFDGSYILAIAGYNAGPGRSRQWTQRFGQTGHDIYQTLNWVELIPFAETRNYVQRVLENLQVYRAVLAPNNPLGIERDLAR